MWLAVLQTEGHYRLRRQMTKLFSSNIMNSVSIIVVIQGINRVISGEHRKSKTE